MFKRNFSKFKALVNHSKGQLSVFLGMSLIILMTLLAFIINVGLFVKAKINLQNAVDAGAWAGATVQAKQLTNIAYLNWEMRNTYKEWMFKYYVLGQAAMNKTRLTSAYALNNLQATGDNMSFRSDAIFKPGQVGYDRNAYDKYNVPSICFHFGNMGTEFNICEKALVPGLPRFDPISIPGISEHNEVFLDSIVKTKAKNCADRTEINFGVALTWAYGIGKPSIPGAAEIASNRAGAWPKAFELAVRMRNLESFVNRPAISGGICGDGDCAVEANSLDSEYQILPFNERPIKAFWSAYRNLNPDMQGKFVLHEIAPNPMPAGDNTLSSFLIPSSANISGVSARTKQYLDLQPYPLNLVTYYTSFAPTTGEFDNRQIGEAACARSNTAIPVPGYLFGYIKNPELLTYYAVKGKTKFVGLFYPFDDPEGLEISAYAAAKPFGGRIGPRLFDIKNNSQVHARRSTKQYRSLPYLIGLDTTGVRPVNAAPDPIIPLRKPDNSPFFISSDGDVVGGLPSAGTNIVFAIPNLVYEYQDTSRELGNNQTKKSGSGNNDTIQIAPPTNSIDGAKTIIESAGLYDKEQFKMFAANISPLGPETVISATEVNQAIINVRRPTKYESLNYLVPTCAIEDDNSDVVSAVGSACESHRIFAPFYGPEALHKTSNDLLEAVNAFITRNNEAIDTFLAGLKKLSDDIKASVTTHTGMVSAADTIYKEPVRDTNCGTLSVAGKFRIFFKSKGEQCKIIPLSLALEKHWSDRASSDPNFQNYFLDHYRAPSEAIAPVAGKKSTEYHTGYMPGPRQGASLDGEIQASNKLTGGGEAKYSRRNYYSVKLISAASLTKNGKGPLPSYSDKAFYQEGDDIGNTMPDIYPSMTPNFKNPLNPSDLQEFGDFTH